MLTDQVLNVGLHDVALLLWCLFVEVKIVSEAEEISRDSSSQFSLNDRKFQLSLKTSNTSEAFCLCFQHNKCLYLSGCSISLNVTSGGIFQKVTIKSFRGHTSGSPKDI